MLRDEPKRDKVIGMRDIWEGNRVVHAFKIPFCVCTAIRM
jgi:hypothetical protein